MPKISVVIITYNEEKNIARCIQSVKDIADEIVVLDSFSKDKTKQICESLGAKFYEHTFDGHIQHIAHNLHDERRLFSHTTQSNYSVDAYTFIPKTIDDGFGTKSCCFNQCTKDTRGIRA